MKELSIEEKAKAYDELFVKAKTMMVENTNEVDGAKILTKFFPQLAESEDEKIRKEIIDIIDSYDVAHLKAAGLPSRIPKYIAWLEKQGADISLFSNEQQKYMEKYISLDKITLIKLLAERDVNNAEIIESFEKQGEQTPKHFELKERHWYICHRAFCCRADHLTVKEGERFMCEKDGVVKGFVIKEPEKYFKEVCAPAPMEDEQKPADKVEPKFKIGDFIVNDYCMGKVIELTNDAYLLDSGQGIPFSCEHNVHLWTIQDAKDGDVLVNWNNNIYLFKGIEEEVVKFYCYYSTNHEEFNIPFNNNSHLGLTEPQFEHHPATKEQRDLLFQKMHDAGYEWDSEKKELKKLEQKPLWSEEDEMGMENILSVIEGYGYPKEVEWIKSIKDRIQTKQEWSEENENNILFLTSIIEECFKDKEKITLCGDTVCANFTKEDVIDKLKSLRPQSQWKPSDEQITWLYRAADNASKDSRMKQVLNELLSNLKKLREGKYA